MQQNHNHHCLVLEMYHFVWRKGYTESKCIMGNNLGSPGDHGGCGVRMSLFSANGVINKSERRLPNPSTRTESPEWEVRVHEYWQSVHALLSFSMFILYLCVCGCVRVCVCSMCCTWVDGRTSVCTSGSLFPIPPRSVSSPCVVVVMKSVAGSPTQYPTPNKLIHH